MIRNRVSLGAWLVLASAGLAWAAGHGASVGAAAPAFSLQDQEGKSVSLADFKGKVVVLEWTNPGCPYVQRHVKAQTMRKLAEKYKDQEVVWLAINSTGGSTNEANAKFVSEHALGYRVLNDAKAETARAYGAKTTPHLFIINKDGNVVYKGGIDNDPNGNKPDRINYVDQALAELLAGKTVSSSETKPYGCSVKY